MNYTIKSVGHCPTLCNVSRQFSFDSLPLIRLCTKRYETIVATLLIADTQVKDFICMRGLIG